LTSGVCVAPCCSNSVAQLHHCSIHTYISLLVLPTYKPQLLKLHYYITPAWISSRHKRS
jgi:hypothetical protein